MAYLIVKVAYHCDVCRKCKPLDLRLLLSSIPYTSCSVQVLQKDAIIHPLLTYFIQKMTVYVGLQQSYLLIYRVADLGLKSS